MTIQPANSLAQLKGFYYTALFKSVSLAADYLCITQPAVSQQVAAFQSTMNRPLLYRKGNEMHLTETGKELFKDVGHILKSIDRLYDHAHEQELPKSISIVGNYGAIDYILPELIATYKQTHPDTTVHIQYQTKENGINALKKGADFFVTPQCFDIPTDYFFIPYQSYPIVLIAHPDHPISTMPSIELSTILNYELVMPADTLMIINQFETIYKQYRSTLNQRLHFKYWETTKRYVEHNLAISIVASIVLTPKDNDLFVYSLADIFQPATYGIVMHNDKINSPLHQFIQTFCNQSS